MLLVSALHLFGCSKIIEFNGFNPGLDILTKLEKGITRKSTVKALLGDPPVVQGANGNTWIYFSQETEKLAFLEPKVVSRSVTLLIFSSNKMKPAHFCNRMPYCIVDRAVCQFTSMYMGYWNIQEICSNSC